MTCLLTPSKSWWIHFERTLPPTDRGLAQLTDAQLQAVSSAYAALYPLPAAINKAETTRGVGSTAAAKLLYFVRPLAITAWDKAISIGCGSPGGTCHAARGMTPLA
jgi:hypothetical protein